MNIPDTRFPQIGETWLYHDADNPLIEKVVILDTLLHPDWGNYTLYQLVGVPFSTSPPHCMNERVFIQLYTPAEDKTCDPSPPENSSSTTSSHKPQPWYSGLQRLWKSLTSFYSKPW